MFAIQEGVRQLRGEAAAQVGSPEISVILGNGGMFATAGVLVLGRQPAVGRGGTAAGRRLSGDKRKCKRLD